MSYGGYGNRGGYDYQRRDRINEDEVPESKHTIFIRGLPGDMSTDEIKEYFEDRIGPVSFDFVKTSADQQRLFVAVRFETRDDAKEAMSKYSDSDLMGHRCELTWFKDIRRYAQYQSLNQQSQGGAIPIAMMIEVVRVHEIEVVLQVIVDLQVENLVIRRGVAPAAVKGQPVKIVIDDLLLGTQTPLKVVKRTVTEIRIENIARRTENIRNLGRHAPAGSPVSPNQEDSPTPSAPAAADPPPKAEAEQPNTDLAPPPLPPPIISPSPDEPPRKVLRRMSPPAGSAVTPPSVAAQEEEKLAHEAQETVMAAIDLPPPPNPPMFSSEKKQVFSDSLVNSSLCKSEQQDKKPATPPSELPSAPTPVQQSTISSLSETPSKLASSRFPTTTRLFTQLKEIQSTIIKTVKVEPKSNEASGGLRLSSLATCQQDTDEEKRAIRENRLSKLDEISLERFMVRKKKLEETFRGDCQTYAFVTRKLIEKDPSLESQLRIALIENMEDLEKQVYEQVDVYLDTICD
ncbi:hypothetical protein ANCCEY_07363 [Ancylostoma ceylanicum]|uniref:RRM domain-containing protein n=1 Tax=Ancylostoma ceylanicum TaxID=53326 RepID=A0A0D6M0X5_9BILA|nr:hypothetical protein ANCCEY_07363 [Ancylostoma ceylanicum]